MKRCGQSPGGPGGARVGGPGGNKVTRLSTINDYHKGGLKMIDLETMCKSLRLAWLKRIFSENGGKYYLNHLLKSFGGPFFISM